MSLRSLPGIGRYRRQLRIALLLLVLGAFGVQQWAMQSHWHASVAQASAGDSAKGDSSGDPQRDPGGAPVDKDCLWCHVASHGSAAAGPAVFQQLAAVPALLFVPLPAGIDADFAVTPAHAWRSRGPPEA